MVAGEPVEVQVRVEDELEVCKASLVTLGAAGGRHNDWNEVLPWLYKWIMISQRNTCFYCQPMLGEVF